MAAKAHSPLSTPHPLLLPVLPEKENVLCSFLSLTGWAVLCRECYAVYQQASPL